MHVEIVEEGLTGTKSVCCGDNFYGLVPNEQVEKRIQLRASQLSCQDVVVYCIGCVRGMNAAGKIMKYKMREQAVSKLGLAADSKVETA